ncbi:hypothetical protein JVT61DRAFT_9988 [Boletus reticuloceps]|uniref:Uncharacterized protein n=1 Tax=Boletus reticuloceps TaxID=495285 RepID=A0A8I2YXG8_9AGAM|nr:hypothetical protein JVT61DRAFT_9988 [Boletus reticuloceps]
MAMVKFSYTDTVRAAFASCLPCFTPSPSESASSSPPNAASTSLLSEPRSTSTSAIRPSSSSSSNDLEHLLRDPDSDGISLHSNLGAAPHRRARRRRRPKFSMTLFGYTLFGRPPIYLADDEEDDSHGMSNGRARALITNSSSTLDSDAAPLDASTIERLTSPDHYAALAAERESERQRLVAEEEARRKAERRARRQERKARARAVALMSLTGASPHPDVDTFEGFQGSGMVPTSLSHQAGHVIPDRPGPDVDHDGSNASHSSDADDADLGGELYARKKKPSGARSGSGSDSRSRTSTSFSFGDTSHIQNVSTHVTHQFIPYPHTEMHLPAPMRKTPHRSSKRTSIVSSVTSQSTSTAPYTPVESLAETPAVAAFPVPQERYLRDGEHADFPSVGLSGKRRPKSFDPRAFLAHQG